MTKLVIQKGATYQDTVRVETDQWQYKAITGISQAAPVVITAVGHGLKTGWRAAVVSVKGMREINADNSEGLTESDLHAVTVVDPDHISINDIDASTFGAYTSGGYLQFKAPLVLTSAEAVMTITDRDGGSNILLTIGTLTGEIVIDATANTITRTIPAAITAALAWARGWHEMYITLADGTVLLPAGCEGPVTVEQ